HREVGQVEQVAEETGLCAEQAGAGERGGAALVGADEAGEPLVQGRGELAQPPGWPGGGGEGGGGLAVGGIRLGGRPGAGDPEAPPWRGPPGEPAAAAPLCAGPPG